MRTFHLKDVSEEVDVCTGRGSHDGHGERSVHILQVAPHWRLTGIAEIYCIGLSFYQLIVLQKELWSSAKMNFWDELRTIWC